MHMSAQPEIFVDPNRPSPRLRPLKALRHMRALIANKEDTEQVFHIVEALNGNVAASSMKAFLSTEAGRRAKAANHNLPAILDDHESLRHLPEGSVGRTYVDFMEREGLSAQGLVEESEKFRAGQERFDDDIEWYHRRMRDYHDLYHILTGYGRDALGEVCVLAFTHSQWGGRGINFVSFMGARELRKQLPKGIDPMAARKEAAENGKRASRIPLEDIGELLAEDLEAARKRLNIKPPSAYFEALKRAESFGLQSHDFGMAS